MCIIGSVDVNRDMWCVDQSHEPIYSNYLYPTALYFP